MFAWFGRKRKESMAATPMPQRYQGKPLLIVLENYVLDCIGRLSADKQALAASVVQRVFGGGADWKATVRATLHLEDSTDQSIVQLWAKNQEIASRANQVLLPEDFARMFVDSNFAQFLA